jgi:hypothetical protein
MKAESAARSASSRSQATRRSILRVDHGAGRWKAIPIRLINDERLGLDTRGFAAWLLARPDGWQIRSSALPRLLSSRTERVGRDKTRRFFRELESAKYLTRTRWRAANGRWIWHYCFRPDPSSIEMPRATMDGLAGDGSSIDGSTVGGQHVDLPQTLISNRSDQSIQRTTTTAMRESGGLAAVGDCSSVQFPECLTGKRLAAAQKLMARCPQVDAQAVLDELSAMVAQGAVRYPMGLLTVLVERAIVGEFAPNRSRNLSVVRKPSGNNRSTTPAPHPQLAADVAKQVISDLHSKFGSGSQ